MSDWREQAACRSYKGPINELPTSYCAVCPVQEPCNELYLSLQSELTQDGPHATRLNLGGVWGGAPKFDAPKTADEVSPVVPCGCDAPTFARGACREHYNQQYWQASKDGMVVVSAPRTCTIGDCTDKHVARGMCSHHYHKWRKTHPGASRPEPKMSDRPDDEPTYAGYSRAKRAGRDPTEAQLAARAEYGHKRWLARS